MHLSRSSPISSSQYLINNRFKFFRRSFLSEDFSRPDRAVRGGMVGIVPTLARTAPGSLGPRSAVRAADRAADGPGEGDPVPEAGSVGTDSPDSAGGVQAS
jgi:hypothetical protein